MTASQRLINRVTDGVRGSLLIFVQVPLLVGVGFVVVISGMLESNGRYSEVVAVGVVLLVVSIAAALVPWHRIEPRWQIVLAIVDVIIIAVLRDIVFLQLTGLNVLVLIPAIWLAFSYRVPAVVLAAAATFFVAFYPFIEMGNWPATSAGWGAAFLFPVTVTAVAIAVHIAATRGRVQSLELLAVNEDLRVALALGVESTEALRLSVADGIDGAEQLRVAVARGLAGDESLRVSVAQGVDNRERLRVSMAEGIVGAEALRVSVAEGVDDKEKLRVSVAEGVDDREKLRVSVAEGVEGAEALRASVASGLVGAEALRVSVAEGLFSSEALRVSVASGLDAASTALAVVDTVDAGITFYDPDGEILLTNDTARALAVSGNPSPSHPSQAPLVFEDDRITPIAAIDQVFGRAARGELVSRRSYWVGIGKDQRAMMATSQYVRRVSGELIGTVVATHDVTPLAEAILSRDQFMTTVSHELRTPLTSVIGYLELIEDTIDIAVSGVEHEFGVVQRNAKRLLELINDLLTTAEGQASLERRPFNIAELADNSLNAIRPGAAAVGITVRAPILPSIMAEVDASRIGDVLDKLLSNAVKFNKPGGEVTLTAVKVEDEVVIRISDTGTGINADDQTHIFERFFRSPSARFGEIAGTGLGLSTAKIIVDAHHGALSVESVVGEGTTMELRLPLRVADPQKAKVGATSIF